MFEKKNKNNELEQATSVPEGKKIIYITARLLSNPAAWSKEYSLISQLTDVVLIFFGVYFWTNMFLKKSK